MGERAERKILPFPARPAVGRGVGDLRFRTVVGEADWARLPAAVRARFGKRIAHCRTVVYSGEVVECEISRCGRALAWLARLIGGPLPLTGDVFVPAVVCVTEDAPGGQCWTRLYGRRRGFPQVIRSSKRFCGPTGIEEHIGGGFGIALRTEVTEGALHFVSDHYFVSVARLRLRLPRWLEPGAMRVSHIDCGRGAFAFVLLVTHPLLGPLVRQTCLFQDPADAR